MDACLRSAERPFQDLASLKEKHFCPFVEFFFGILRSVAEFRRFREINWDVFVNRLRNYMRIAHVWWSKGVQGFEDHDIRLAND